MTEMTGFQIAALYVGIGVFALIGAVFLWALFEIAYAVAAACSVIRFLLRMNKAHNIKKFTALDAALSFPAIWWFLIGTRNSNVVWRHQYGQWYGIGNWVVAPNAEDGEAVKQ